MKILDHIRDLKRGLSTSVDVLKYTKYLGIRSPFYTWDPFLVTRPISDVFFYSMAPSLKSFIKLNQWT